MNRRLRELFKSWSSQDEDSRNAALLITGISLVVIVAIALVGYGYIQDRAENKDTILTVGKKDISYDYFSKRLGQFMQPGANLSPEQFSSILGGIVAQVEQEELMRHVAKTRDITVSDEELDAEMHKDLSVAADAPKEVYATALRRELLDSGLSLDEYKEIQRAQVVENKVRDEAKASLADQTEQVNIRLLQVATKEDADKAQARLNSGEALGLVAGAMSTDSSSSKGGEVGWIARGTYNSKLEDAIFAQAVGTTSGIIETDEGFYIVEVRAHETRETTDQIRTALGNRAFRVALNESRKEIGSEIVMTASQLNRLANKFRSSLNAGG